MHTGRQLTPADYWLMVRRHKGLLAGLFLTVFFGTALWGLSLPDVYRATTLILVESQKVPPSYVQATVSASMQERLRTISQQILSRTWLERVINELGLLGNQRDVEGLERYINTMRQQTTIDVKAPVKGGGGNAFSISYEGEDPITVTMIANKLASLFIEENLKVREQQAIGTTEFLDRELQRVRGLLVEQERTTSEFKHHNMGELPEQQDANLRALDRLQFQLQANQLAIESARSRKSLILGSGPQGLTPKQQLAARRAALAELQRHYTNAYPDVRRLKHEVAELEAQLRNPPDKSAPPEPMQLDAVENRSLPWRLQQDINEIDLQIQRLTRQQALIRERIADYEQRVASTPVREQELMELTRDYKGTRQSYNSLLERQMQAAVAENLEKRQKAEQFKILDPARTPSKPWKPNRLKIVLMGLLGGLGVGCGAVFLVEYLDSSLRNPEDLKQLTGLPVLGAVSLVITSVELRRQRLRKGLCFTAWLLIPAAVLAGVHVFWMQLDLLAARSLQLFQL